MNGAYGIQSYEDVRKEIIKGFGKTEEEVRNDIETIKKWCDDQKHLPEIPSNVIIQSFLLMNKLSIEKTKKKIDCYYTIKTLIPEIYDNKHPMSPHMRKAAEAFWVVPLPYLTKGLNRLVVLKLMGKSEEFDCYDFWANVFNFAEIRLREDISNEEILIYDLEHLKPGHFSKISPMSIKHAATILEKVYVTRLLGVYFINCPNLIDKLLTIVKPLLTEKIRSRIRVYSNFEGLYETIPKNLLPKDYGGDLPTLKELKNSYLQKLVENKELFDRLANLRVNESLRPEPLKNDEILGFYGNFKKLNVD